MSKTLRSIVVGIVLALILGTAAHAHPLARTPAREAAPAGIVERAWSWWAQLAEKVAGGWKGLQVIWGKAGSQMDPDGVTMMRTQPPTTPIPTSSF